MMKKHGMNISNLCCVFSELSLEAVRKLPLLVDPLLPLQGCWLTRNSEDNNMPTCLHQLIYLGSQCYVPEIHPYTPFYNPIVGTSTSQHIVYVSDTGTMVPPF